MMPLKACLPTMSWSEVLMMLLPDMPAAAATLLQRTLRRSWSPVPQALASVGQSCLRQGEGILLPKAYTPQPTRHAYRVCWSTWAMVQAWILAPSPLLAPLSLEDPLLSNGCVCGAAPSMCVETGLRPRGVLRQRRQEQPPAAAAEAQVQLPGPALQKPPGLCLRRWSLPESRSLLCKALLHVTPTLLHRLGLTLEWLLKSHWATDLETRDGALVR